MQPPNVFTGLLFPGSVRPILCRLMQDDDVLSDVHLHLDVYSWQCMEYFCVRYALLQNACCDHFYADDSSVFMKNLPCASSLSLSLAPPQVSLCLPHIQHTPCGIKRVLERKIRSFSFRGVISLSSPGYVTEHEQSLLACGLEK